MRSPLPLALSLSAVLMAACSGSEVTEPPPPPEMPRLAVIDDASLAELMLSVADPAEALAHFRSAHEAAPGRIGPHRGLARALVRAGRASEAVPHWTTIAARSDASNDDRVALADALMRTGDWEAAETALGRVPDTVQTFDRIRLEALVADARGDWDSADGFYETAVGMTTQPAGVLNNWGFSRLSRGDAAAAERLFVEALGHDQTMFTTKNNLAMARGAQRNYTLPLIPMTQTERAQLLHTLAITAIRQDDVAIGRTLLREAVDTHPQHFDEAVRALRALDAEGAG